jgi:hypothetical protein
VGKLSPETVITLPPILRNTSNQLFHNKTLEVIMARKASSDRSSRRPSLSRIKNTERQMLHWEGKALFFSNKIKEVDSLLKNLDKSSVRLKASRRVQLMKLKSLLTTRLMMAQRKAKLRGDALKTFSTVQW